MSRQELRRRLGIAVLGSTGSIGRQTLDVIDAHPDRFHVVTLAARSPSPIFFDQVSRYAPRIASLAEPSPSWPSGATRGASGQVGLIEAATHPDVDIVVVATSGHDAIRPTIAAIEHGKTIALANKETLVCAGALIMPLAKAHGVEIRPIDSEHSAIWQALGDTPTHEVSKIIITASGGPFRTTPADALSRVTAQEALAHPTWSMGHKITIDSATLMNKGLEVIEGHWLFGMPYQQIEVVVHPESIVHSLVEFIDGSQLAQLGLPDMRVPIQLALTFPDRLERSGDRLDLAQIGSLHFEAPDADRFPCLRLAREAGVAGGLYPTVLSAADDEVVDAFIAGRLRFVDIAGVIHDVLNGDSWGTEVTLEAIMEADARAREVARAQIRARATRLNRRAS